MKACGEAVKGDGARRLDGNKSKEPSQPEMRIFVMAFLVAWNESSARAAKRVGSRKLKITECTLNIDDDLRDDTKTYHQAPITSAIVWA